MGGKKLFSAYDFLRYPMEYGKLTHIELDFLRGIVGPDRVSTGESVLDLHGKDESFHGKRRIGENNR